MRFIRRYPWVVAALVVGGAGLTLQVAGWDEPSRWLVTGFASLIALLQGVGMVRSILAGHLGLDILAVTAIVATLLVGEYWASLIIVLMLTGGEALEDAASHRAKRQLQSLLDRVPQQAHRFNADGSLSDVPIDAVHIGDRLLVRPSELVPVDATLVTSRAEFDESSLTGESLPIEREAGQIVLSGSLNGSQAVEVIAHRVAADSEYQAIARLVEQAASSKAPLVRLADRYALPFTAVAYTIAGLAWWWSGDPVRFAEVLVVATPCPLLIAAPVAFMGGMSRAARSGVVIKDAGTLERLSRVSTVAFDKTGTLTLGHPEVIRVASGEEGVTDQELLALAASAERYSTHVLARAIVEEAERQGLPRTEATHAEEIATHGVQASIGGRQVFVGKAHFIAENCGEVNVEPLEPGETAVYVGADEGFLGRIVLRDPVREEASRTLRRLVSRGITNTVMVTGDQQQTADHIARDLGITTVHAECLPRQKVEVISALDAKAVMMVGDGVNDAPVLAAAAVGVAMGARGSTVASESADIVLLVDDLERVADALETGQHTVKIALQSIWLGIVISVGLMVVAALGYLPAVAGALLQELVDLVTILGALRALGPGRRTARTGAANPASARVAASTR